MKIAEDAIAPALQSEGWELPEFERVEFHPRRTKYCVCIPVINEGGRIEAQLKRMSVVVPMPDIVIADGGSTDGSMNPEKLRSLGVRTILTKRGSGKLSAQMRMGLAYALREGYQGVILIDGNNKDDPAAVPQFVAALERGVDHVQGSRFIAGGHGINTPLVRLLGVRLIHAPAISVAAGRWYTDTTNGFRAYSRRLLLDPRVAPFRKVFSGYELHYYLAIRAARLGYLVEEIPVTRAYPAGVPTPSKISSVRGNLLVLRTLGAACLGRYNPHRGR